MFECLRGDAVESARAVIAFEASEAAAAALVGGKGANLAKLVAAEFPVPPGFTVTTAAYTEALKGRRADVLALVASIDYDDADHVEATTAKIRELISSIEIPLDLAMAIGEAYSVLGADCYVAVRSSGTAEDLEGASFAGLHDTLLDVRGVDGVLDAVRACWASMWTARATSYRWTRSFPHEQAAIAVVVQRMVAADVSGVMFTGNPLTAVVEETVINASWGLGEAIVSGRVTPDQFTILDRAQAPNDRVVGEKAIKVVRDPDRSSGTVTQEVAVVDRERLTLTDGRVSELARLGRRVMAHYDSVPQDLEWALEGDTFYLLQTRPITGVQFTWDGDIDDRGERELDRDDDIWTRSWSDEQWTGAIAPLTYAYRARMFSTAYRNAAKLWGIPEVERRRMFKYYKGDAYYSSTVDEMLVSGTVLPSMRPMMLVNIAPPQHQHVLEGKLSLLDYAKVLARIQFLGGPRSQLYKWFGEMRQWFADTEEQANGLTADELRQLEDSELRRYIDDTIALEITFARDFWTPYCIWARDANLGLGGLLAAWYDGANASAFQELLTGNPERTATAIENIDLWRLSMRIRESAELRRLIDEHEGDAFFVALESSDEGRAFLEEYRAFAAQHGHRGHADRDMIFPRRADDPGIDHRNLKALVESDAPDPEANEQRLAARRAEVTEDVIANLRRKPLGAVRVEVFKLLCDYAQRFLIIRDHERYWIDRSTYSLRRGFAELGGRMVARGLIDHRDDVHFLGYEELFEHWEGRSNRRLVAAKIAGRQAAFQRYEAKEVTLPSYFVGGQAADLDHVEAEEGVFKGKPTSSGRITGTARVIKTVKGIGTVKKGEILITNATDPGWTPVFMVIGGLILETGGLLAHGALLSREYGLPAVQLPGAMSLIPDGATIAIDGDTGTVQVIEEPAQAPAEREPEPVAG
jgi:rifampicin phosphotransferase